MLPCGAAGGGLAATGGGGPDEPDVPADFNFGIPPANKPPKQNNAVTLKVISNQLVIRHRKRLILLLYLHCYLPKPPPDGGGAEPDDEPELLPADDEEFFPSIAGPDLSTVVVFFNLNPPALIEPNNPARPDEEGADGAGGPNKNDD